MNYDRDRLDALRSCAINLGLGLIEQKSCVELRGRDGVLFRRCYTLAEIEAALDFRKKVANREPEVLRPAGPPDSEKRHGPFDQ